MRETVVVKIILLVVSALSCSRNVDNKLTPKGFGRDVGTALSSRLLESATRVCRCAADPASPRAVSQMARFLTTASPRLSLERYQLLITVKFRRFCRLSYASTYLTTPTSFAVERNITGKSSLHIQANYGPIKTNKKER